MLDVFIKDLCEVYELVVSNGDKEALMQFKIKYNIDDSIGKVYEALRKREKCKETGSFYTPAEIVTYMTQDLLVSEDFIAEEITILDPSCGCAYFLTEAAKVLYEKYIIMGIENPYEIIVGNNLHGFDIDEIAVKISILEIFNLTGIISSNIVQKDFLQEDVLKYDYIIGNPPYIGHKIITADYRKLLKKKYGDVFSDKSDLYYCFIKKSVDSLKTCGRMSFLTSRYMMESQNGKGIREYLLQNGKINKIIDFYGVRFIKRAGVDTIILDFSKKIGYFDKVEFLRLKTTAKGRGAEVFKDISLGSEVYVEKILMDKRELSSDGFIILKEIEKNILDKITGVELSEVCQSYQGIITGCDKAFISRVGQVEASELFKPWIKGKDIQAFKVKEAEYQLMNTGLIKNCENYTRELKRLEIFKDRLSGRRECKKGIRRWFDLQWGRDDEVFEKRKIIFPYKSSSNRFAIDEGNYFSADIYALKIKDCYLYEYDYEYLVGILNSRLYEFYIKSMAKKLGENLYEYYPNKIMKLKIPRFIKGISEHVSSSSEDLRDKIDNVLNKHLNINEKEYEVIKKWCEN